ncbi:MAG TPA: ABC transporter permease subunit [Thermoanaerobaculia bacterium]
MRRLRDRAFRLAAALCGAAALVLFAGLAGAILVRGLPAVDWGFLTRAAAGAGTAGGLRYQILGTLLLVATALAAALPLALGIALVRAVYLRGDRARRRLAAALYAGNAVPSILWGLAGLIVFGRWLGWGKSWLAGGLLLGLMILPTLAAAIAECMEALPAPYLEQAAALGLSRSQRVRAVVLPGSVRGIVSGALLGIARAAGETAPIMLTAAVFSGATLPAGVRESPVLALPYHVFVLAQDSFDPAVEPRLWGAAAVLLALVAALGLLALPVRLIAHEEARRA